MTREEAIQVLHHIIQVAIVKAELAKYEPYWKKVIQIRADV